MALVSVTLSYLFRYLTTETEKHLNENGFIGNSAILKYWICEHRQQEKQTDKEQSSHMLGLKIVLFFHSWGCLLKAIVLFWHGMFFFVFADLFIENQ